MLIFIPENAVMVKTDAVLPSEVEAKGTDRQWAVQLGGTECAEAAAPTEKPTCSGPPPAKGALS